MNARITIPASGSIINWVLGMNIYKIAHRIITSNNDINFNSELLFMKKTSIAIHRLMASK